MILQLLYIIHPSFFFVCLFFSKPFWKLFVKESSWPEFFMMGSYRMKTFINLSYSAWKVKASKLGYLASKSS